MLPHKLRHEQRSESHGVCFFLKNNLLSGTLRSEVWERVYGQDMVDDLMVPAHCGKEGVVEWRPSGISHKVSMGSASKHLRKARV